jgi:hypothetical protein
LETALADAGECTDAKEFLDIEGSSTEVVGDIIRE